MLLMVTVFQGRANSPAAKNNGAHFHNDNDGGAAVFNTNNNLINSLAGVGGGADIQVLDDDITRSYDDYVNDGNTITVNG